MEWQAPQQDVEAITGYKLLISDRFEQRVVYDGYQNPNLKTLEVDNLTPGEQYGFSVAAYNFNGLGAFSDIIWYRACTEPSGQSPPVVLLTTKTSMLFQWSAVENDGACPVTSFKLYIDDGSNGDFISIDESVIANKSYLREHLVTFDVQDAGKTFRFRISSLNEIGESISAIRS